MAKRPPLFVLGKVLEGLALVIILVGLTLSIDLGMREESLESMRYESYALLLGLVLFFVGWLLERYGGR